MIRCQMNPQLECCNQVVAPSNEFADCPMGHSNCSVPMLARSKSLNDISNDSQISAFASDRSINLHINNINNNNNDNNNTSVVDNNYPYNIQNQQQQHQQHISGMPIDLNQFSLFNQQQQQQQQQQASTCYTNNNSFDSNQCGNNQFQQMISGNSNSMSDGMFGFSQPCNGNNLIRNLNNNQCSKPLTQTGAVNQTNGANVFNLCNPLAMNLSGVTEQIGNLHL